MDATTQSVSHASSSGSSAGVLTDRASGGASGSGDHADAPCPGASVCAGFYAAAESLALTFIAILTDDSGICTCCHRGSIYGLLDHSRWCGPGVLLEMCEARRQVLLKLRIPVDPKPKGPSHRTVRAVVHPMVSAVERVDAAIASAAIPEVIAAPERHVVYECRRAIGVFGELDGYDVLVCCKPKGHGGWHANAVHRAVWPQDAASIWRFSCGRLQVRRFDGEPPIYIEPEVVESDESWQASEAILRVGHSFPSGAATQEEALA